MNCFCKHQTKPESSLHGLGKEITDWNKIISAKYKLDYEEKRNEDFFLKKMELISFGIGYQNTRFLCSFCKFGVVCIGGGERAEADDC